MIGHERIERHRRALVRLACEWAARMHHARTRAVAPPGRQIRVTFASLLGTERRERACVRACKIALISRARRSPQARHRSQPRTTRPSGRPRRPGFSSASFIARSVVAARPQRFHATHRTHVAVPLLDQTVDDRRILRRHVVVLGAFGLKIEQVPIPVGGAGRLANCINRICQATGLVLALDFP